MRYFDKPALKYPDEVLIFTELLLTVVDKDITKHEIKIMVYFNKKICVAINNVWPFHGIYFYNAQIEIKKLEIVLYIYIFYFYRWNNVQLRNIQCFSPASGWTILISQLRFYGFNFNLQTKNIFIFYVYISIYKTCLINRFILFTKIFRWI